MRILTLKKVKSDAAKAAVALLDEGHGHVGCLKYPHEVTADINAHGED